MAKIKQDGSVETQAAGGFELPDTAELQRMEGGAAVRQPAAETVLGGFGGDTEDLEIKYPIFRVKNGKPKNRELAKLPDGTLVLGDGGVVAEQGEPAEVIILSVRRYWKENQPVYDPNSIPDEKPTKQAVIDSGGTFDRRTAPPGAKEYRPAAEIRLLVKKPEGTVSSLFGFELEGTEWAAARMFVDRSAAQEMLPVLAQDISTGGLRARGFLSGVYEIRTRERQFQNGNTTWVPRPRLIRFSSDDTVAKLKEAFGCFVSAPAAAAAAADDVPL